MRRYSEEEKIEILKEVESLGNVSLVSKKRGLPHTTIHNWIKKGLRIDKRDQLAENRSLRKRVSGCTLDNLIIDRIIYICYY